MREVVNEVLPRLEALGVALADEEDDGRGVGRGVERELLLPVAVDELAARERYRVDVVAERERHDVRLDAVDYRAGLLAAAAVCFSSPVFAEENDYKYIIDLAGVLTDKEKKIYRCKYCEEKYGERTKERKKAK